MKKTLAYDFFVKTAKGGNQPNGYFNLRFSNSVFGYGCFFTKHIMASIPLYERLVKKVGLEIIRNNKGSLDDLKILDIGASNSPILNFGALKSSIKMAIEPIKEMKFDNPEHGNPLNITWVHDYFGRNNFLPKTKFNVILELFTFQFDKGDTRKLIEDVVSVLADKGVFYTTEKLFDATVWTENENSKDKFKRLWFSEKEIEDKSKVVLSEMNDNILEVFEYEEILNDNFSNVERIDEGGNFYAYKCYGKK